MNDLGRQQVRTIGGLGSYTRWRLWLSVQYVHVPVSDCGVVGICTTVEPWYVWGLSFCLL